MFTRERKKERGGYMEAWLLIIKWFTIDEKGERRRTTVLLYMWKMYNKRNGYKKAKIERLNDKDQFASCLGRRSGRGGG